jgi:hypothetical protein
MGANFTKWLISSSEKLNLIISSFLKGTASGVIVTNTVCYVVSCQSTRTTVVITVNVSISIHMISVGFLG